MDSKPKEDFAGEQGDRKVSYPRTLIVSEAPFGIDNGFGVTLTTFFQGWPKAALFQFFASANAPTNREICESMVPVDVRPVWSRRHAFAHWFGRRAAWRGKYSARWLNRNLGGFQPEVVYAFVFSGCLLDFAAWVANEVGCPLVTHVGDDGLDGLRTGVARSTQELLALAHARLAISDEMRAEYESRYGLDFAVLHNGAAAELLQHPRSVPDPTGPFVIRYLGSIVRDYHCNAIEDVAEAARRLAAAGIPVRFEICGGAWTRAEAEKLTDGCAAIYRPDVARLEGYRLLQSADLLVVPVNFDHSARERVHLSLPTKLTEYLGSGTPTLVYGPAGCAPVDFCRRHGVGAVLTERSMDRLTSFIAQSIEQRVDASARAARDREFIREHFSSAGAQRQLRAVLSQAAAWGSVALPHPSSTKGPAGGGIRVR